jgi:pyridoxamine 5'-phosphate oxidase
MSASDPLQQFRDWFNQALAAGRPKTNAMALATSDPDGRPACRVVLLSSFDERGFVFHTNYQSRKGEQLDANPRAALTFWWDELGYQVRIEGRIEKTTAQESDAYFAQRPRASQLGAWASEQSRAITSHADLRARVDHIAREYDGRDVPRPPHWGGYRVIPEAFEFWEDRQDRLHERVRYERAGIAGWRVRLLAP